MIKKLIGFANTQSFKSRYNRARTVIYVIVSLLALLIALPSLKDAFILNLDSKRILTAIAISNNGTKYWYAAGLPAVTEEELKILMIRNYNFSLTQGICTEQEKRIWQEFPSPIYPLSGKQLNDPLKVLLRARRLECDGKLSEATRILDINSQNNIVYLKKIDLLNRMAQKGVAFSMAVNSICPPNAKWCEWCMAKAMHLDDYADSETQYLSNGSPVDLLHINMQTIGSLQMIYNSNTTIDNEVPLIVTGILPLSEADNYLDYTKVPAHGTTVRLRVSGVVLGSNISSSVFPRLIFWSGDKYIGEVRLGYNVTGKFNVDYWVSLPETTDAVTPRITFVKNSFANGQEIAICSTELAIAP